MVLGCGISFQKVQKSRPITTGLFEFAQLPKLILNVRFSFQGVNSNLTLFGHIPAVNRPTICATIQSLQLAYLTGQPRNNKATIKR